MQFNAKQMAGIVGLMGCFGISFAGQYQGSAINFKANQIRNHFIYLSPRTVEAQGNQVLSRRFESFLERDKIMQKIKKINVEGTSETTLEVTGLEEAIADDFVQKQNDLQAQHDQCRPKQFGCGAVMVGGGLLMALAASQQVDRQEKSGQAIVVGLGAVLAVSGVAGLYALSGEKARIEKHSAQVKIMQKEWDTFFKIPANS